jgi:hypothetical protein
MPQKVPISGGGFQDPGGNPLALGEIVVALQRDVQVGNVQLSAGIKTKLTLDSNGNVTGSPTLWGPVTYLMTSYSANGERACRLPLSITIPDAASFSLTPA